jgi:O-antigen ligase
MSRAISYHRSITAPSRPPADALVAASERGVKRNALSTLACYGLFVLALIGWVFKLRYEKGDSLLPLSPFQMLVPILCGLSLLYLIFRYRIVFPRFTIRSPGFLLTSIGILCVLCGTTIHVFITPDYRSDAIEYFIRWCSAYFSFLAIVLLLELGGEIRFFVWGLVAGLVLTVACVEIDRFGIEMPIYLMGSRYAGLLMHANQYGILISSTAPFLVYLLFRENLPERLLGMVGIPLYFVGLFECLSKTNIALLPVGMALTLIGFSLTSSRALIRSLVLIGLGIVGLSFLLSFCVQLLSTMDEYETENMTQFLTDPSGVKSVEGREGVWDEAKEAIAGSPIWGRSPGWSEENMLLGHAHNLYLQQWIETGLIGLGGVILITIGVLVRIGELLLVTTRRWRPMDDALRLDIACAVSLLIGVAGNCMSSSFHTATLVPFCLVLAVGWIAPRLRNHIQT